MMDESNDKTDKSCIILIRILDYLKSSLSHKGLDFEKCIVLILCLTLKGVRSGVQKLIKKECPKLYDVG
jgi:hypothetical protein